MADTDTLTLRALGATDMPQLLALVREASWNQTEADWTRLLSLGTGLGFADASDHIVASAVTLDYGGRIGWIGMVLVNSAWRRRGLATSLLRTCVSRLSEQGLLPALDATPAGEAVYRKMGFEGDLTITRWRGTGHADPSPAPGGLGREDLPWVADLDGNAFGASREELLSTYLTPDRHVGAGTRKDAFLLDRPGRTARQIGPIVATDTDLAGTLFSAAVARYKGPILIDAFDHQDGFARRIADAGFTPERQLRRMYLGDRTHRANPKLIYAIAGPEIG